MPKEVKIFSLSGIPVIIHWSFLILFLIIFVPINNQLYFNLKFIIFSTLIFSIIMHEYGHALAARRYGREVKKIVLFGLGGQCHIESKDISYYEDVVISFFGPFLNIIFGLLFLSLHMFMYYFNIFRFDIIVFVLWFSNLGMGILNLFPVYPSDGGRILRSIISKYFGEVIAIRVSGVISFASSIFFIMGGAYTFNIPLILIGLFVLRISFAEAKRYDGYIV